MPIFVSNLFIFTHMEYEQLKLDNQLCFPFYAVSRLIIRRYQPFLDELGITYPQYLVLLVLWETDGMPVNDISKRLHLNTNTITPLIQRLEKMNIVQKTPGTDDFRKMYVSLTEKGSAMKEKAAEIPFKLVQGIQWNPDDALYLKNMLHDMIESLK
jgi:MarR family transcriptional regulator, organic hydroperoxide resistance regulator